METPFDRRAFLRGAAALPMVGLAPRRVDDPADDQRARPPGLVPIQTRPDNLEMPFAGLDGFLTPNERFYVRNHFAPPSLDAETWRLKVEGAVERPAELSLAEVRALPERTVTALLECAGNGRVFLDPPQVGLRWGLGGVGCAEWTGVSLGDVLERVGVRDGAVEVVLEGADSGEYREPVARTPGVIPFARSLPLEVARRADVLLAYRMNGEPLSPSHGFPVRAIVPGWYGMASVKWLTRIVVTDRPFLGYFQTMQYTIWERRDRLPPSLAPVTELQTKAQIARPAPLEVVPRGADYPMRGAAWTGGGRVAKVEVSDDGGRTWTEAKLVGEDVPSAWRLWEHTWRTPDLAGRRVVMARATDDRGRTQPMTRDPLWRDAMISHVLPIEVEVR
jgi:DMSO/TMAO reductase YedYZ molybdopterin-dependent catalytic subunit